jgi:hypothetical protein
MNQSKPFKVSISPAQVISKASEIVKNNIPPGSNLNKFKQRPENCGISLLYKSDYGLIHNCSVSIQAIRCENEVATKVVVEVCSCEKMQRLYQKLIAEL